MPGAHGGQKMALDPLAFRDVSELSRGRWKLNRGPLEEKPAFFTTELSLQAQ